MQVEAKKKAADDKTKERMEKLTKAQDEKIQASAANAAAQLAFGSNARWNRWGAKKDAAKPDAGAAGLAAAGPPAGATPGSTPASAAAAASASAAAVVPSAAAPAAVKADGSTGEVKCHTKRHLEIFVRKDFALPFEFCLTLSGLHFLGVPWKSGSLACAVVEQPVIMGARVCGSPWGPTVSNFSMWTGVAAQLGMRAAALAQPAPGERRALALRDLIAVLERDPMYAKSTLLYKLYERLG